MISQLTGGEAILQKEMRETEFRGEKFVYEHHNIRDLETDIVFTNTEIDEGNVQRVYAQYRAAHDIPSPSELKAMREEYGLSASKMSEILGLGINQYARYEQGVMPSESVGKMLRSIQTPSVFMGYLESAKRQFSEEEYKKICAKVQKSFIKIIKSRTDLSWFWELFSPRIMGKVAL